MGKFVDTVNGFMWFVIVAGHLFFFNGTTIFQLKVLDSYRFQMQIHHVIIFSRLHFSIKNIHICYEYIGEISWKLRTGNMLFKQTEYL